MLLLLQILTNIKTKKRKVHDFLSFDCLLSTTDRDPECDGFTSLSRLWQEVTCAALSCVPHRQVVADWQTDGKRNETDNSEATAGLNCLSVFLSPTFCGEPRFYLCLLCSRTALDGRKPHQQEAPSHSLNAAVAKKKEKKPGQRLPLTRCVIINQSAVKHCHRPNREPITPNVAFLPPRCLLAASRSRKTQK